MIARIYGAERRAARERTTELLEQFGLTTAADEKAKTLSGGMQRRLSIAMALISNPRILFLDEPTLGLDVLARRELWASIKRLKGRITIVLTTHYMEEAESLADRIGIMANGTMKATGTVAQLLEQTGVHRLEDAFVAYASEGGVGT